MKLISQIACLLLLVALAWLALPGCTRPTATPPAVTTPPPAVPAPEAPTPSSPVQPTPGPAPEIIYIHSLALDAADIVRDIGAFYAQYRPASAPNFNTSTLPSDNLTWWNGNESGHALEEPEYADKQIKVHRLYFGGGSMLSLVPAEYVYQSIPHLENAAALLKADSESEKLAHREEALKELEQAKSLLQKQATHLIQWQGEDLEFLQKTRNPDINVEKTRVEVSKVYQEYLTPLAAIMHKIDLVWERLPLAQPG